MTTMLPLKRRKIRGVVLNCAPRFRILRAWMHVGRLVVLKHHSLSVLLRYQWHRARAHTSWSRA
jgi:hypothetical protein